MINFKGSQFEREIILWGVRVHRPTLGFKSFWAARCTIAGIEVMHAIRKGQLGPTGTVSPTPAEQFDALAA